VLGGDAGGVEVFQRLEGTVGLHEVESAGVGHLLGLVVGDNKVVVQVVQFLELALAPEGEEQFFQHTRVLVAFVEVGQDLDGLLDLVAEAEHLCVQFVCLHIVRVDLQDVVDSLQDQFLLPLSHLQLSLVHDEALIAGVHADSSSEHSHGFFGFVQLGVQEFALLEGDFSIEFLLLLDHFCTFILHFSEHFLLG